MTSGIDSRRANSTLFSSRFVNLTAIGFTLKSAQQYILRAFKSVPLCSLNQDRWEELPEMDMIQERYAPPYCNMQWDVRRGDKLMLLSFHSAQRSIDRPVLVWQHTVMYAFAVQSFDADPIPQAHVAAYDTI